VIEGLSLSLYENEIFCLLGHNGAGKTTLLNMIGGVIPKSEGVIKIEGFDMSRDRDRILRMIGICSQDDFLYDDLTVEEHL
jgi:ABC-type multidrug transport system ATPase subunit